MKKWDGVVSTMKPLSGLCITVIAAIAQTTQPSDGLGKTENLYDVSNDKAVEWASKWSGRSAVLYNYDKAVLWANQGQK
jgi:hypothetical protein